HIEPTFVTGSLGDYYLSQTAAGQLSNSTGIDLGDPATDPVLELGSYTTRTDGETDAGVVDMGVHYPALPAKAIQLNITVTGNGTVEPGSGTYRQYEVVQLKADPNEGYRIKSWTGTEDDSSLEPDKTLTMIADTNISIEFELIPLHQLITKVDGSNGEISPPHRRGAYYPEGTVVTLIAKPNTTYGIDKWTGTDDDTSWSTKNTVTMDSDKVVTVTFRQPRTFLVPGHYSTISDAINAAYDHGDKVIVSAGTYPGGYDFQGKALTIASEHPDDPASVAATIIDCAGRSRAFMFQSGEGHDSVVDGFTIVNGSAGLADPNTPINTGGTGAKGADALGGAITCLNGSSPTLSNLIIRNSSAWGQRGEDASSVPPPPAPAPPAANPLPELAPLPDPPIPDPNDPNMWYPEDPNGPELPADPNNIDGFNGLNGENGLDGEPGADGANGMPGYEGGGGGLGYGGAMYFDANSAPIILHCTIIDCNAIGGSGGFGGQGQAGQEGQAGQDGQPGQAGQNGGAGLNDGLQGAAGNGGNGGAGGPGGSGGAGGVGGNAGAGAEALGGAIYFGSNCRPTIRYCTILNCSTTQGVGSYGGLGGSGGGGGGAGGVGGTGGAAGAGNPNGVAGTDNSATAADGGNGGNGSNGGNASTNGARSWAGAIYFGENCDVDISDTIISNNATTTFIQPDPNGTNGGIGGVGGAGGTNGGAGADGAPGANDASTTSTFGGANYYDIGSKVKLTNCVIAYNTTERHDGGGEYYSGGSTAIFNHADFIGNRARYGAGQFYDPFCTIEVKNCEYSWNAATRDGGGLFIRYECALDIDDSKFSSNLALGSGGGVYGGGEFDVEESTWYNNSTIKIEDTEFYRNLAGFGGGIYWHGEDSEVTVSYSKFDDNTADTGGGLYFSRGAPKIIGCTIVNNDTDDTLSYDPTAFRTLPVFGTVFGDVSFGGGGGIFCWSSDARIEDCIITDNSSVGSGGGVYLGGDPSAPILRNCLIRENVATIDGGGVVANWYAEPTITNCTIVNNQAIDIEDSVRGKGGGLSCTYGAKTTLINSILWDNRGNIGNQIAIGSDNELIYIDRPATLTVSYSDIKGGQSAEAIHVEPGRTLNWLAGNIDFDPLFVQQNFLSQTQTGQASDSPCVDAGSDSVSNLGLDKYSTRTDLIVDAGIVDIGYHAIVFGPEQELTLVVVGNGTLRMDPDTIDPDKTTHDPDNQTYTYTFNTCRGDIISFTATPEEGYRVKSWTGTDKDPAWNTNVNMLTVNGSQTVRVEFEPDVIRILKVPSEYLTIEEAVQAADERGTKIIVDRGVHTVTNPDGINFRGKSVTLMSTDPDNPDVIANTIIDCRGARLSNTRAFHFHSGEDYNTKVIGFTIRNGYINGGNGMFGFYGVLQPFPYELQRDAQPDPNSTPPRAQRGGDIEGDGYGGGILCENGSSPTIKNCIITNCTVTGAHGGDGAQGQFLFITGMIRGDMPDDWSYIAPTDADQTNVQTSGDGQWGGHAGAGTGHGYGGAIACLEGSSPTITNCIFRDNSALGGMGGTGGGGGTTSGGNESGGGDGGDAIGDGIGGGIYSDGQSCPIITRCKFENNIAATGIPGEGGAVGIGGGLTPPAPVGSTGGIQSNGGIAGGAVYFDNDADANIVNSTFSGNQAYDLSTILYGGLIILATEPTPTYTRGGALYSTINNNVVLKDCEFEGNLGGAIYCSSGVNLDVNDCSFSENANANEGSAIYIADGVQADIKNSGFSDNSALIDGGAIYTISDANFTRCSFINNIAGQSGGAIEGYFDVNTPDTEMILKFNFESCSFIGNEASRGFRGWGGAVHFQDFDAVFKDCYFINNTAKSGGGLFLSHGTVDINGGIIKGNKSVGGSGVAVVTDQDIIDAYMSQSTVTLDFVPSFFDGSITESMYDTTIGVGGGVFCGDTQATIEDVTLSDNSADGVNCSGGAISFYGGRVSHSIKNCLLTGNSAADDGGAISIKLFAKPEIKNCTFVNNRTDGMGGAVFSDWSSDATITDSIFQGNSKGAVADGDKDFDNAEENDGLKNSTVKFCLFQRNSDGDYVLYDPNSEPVSVATYLDINNIKFVLYDRNTEPVTITTDIVPNDTNNIQGDPLFISGPLGEYYLSQIKSGQTQNSLAIDAGSGLATELGLSDFTTRTDGEGDSDQVDIGYHYRDPDSLPQYALTTRVASGQGTVGPSNGIYYAGTVVKLNADPVAGWRISKWSGTDSDSTKATDNTVTILNTDAIVEVEFYLPAVINVPGDYQTIQAAVTAANEGDQIIVDTGVYYGGYSSYALMIDKSVKITSRNPHDPDVVASTIIRGNRGVGNWNYIGVVFRLNTDADTVLNGFTIEDFGGNWTDGDDGDRGQGHPNGEDGYPAEGAGIYIEAGASPVIKNCIIRNNF
ncbi:MAG: hypothetical protein D4R45_06590, partial [Planctomycetaceae bacterium]